MDPDNARGRVTILASNYMSCPVPGTFLCPLHGFCRAVVPSPHFPPNQKRHATRKGPDNSGKGLSFLCFD